MGAGAGSRHSVLLLGHSRRPSQLWVPEKQVAPRPFPSFAPEPRSAGDPCEPVVKMWWVRGSEMNGRMNDWTIVIFNYSVRQALAHSPGL